MYLSFTSWKRTRDESRAVLEHLNKHFLHLMLLLIHMLDPIPNPTLTICPSRGQSRGM